MTNRVLQELAAHVRNAAVQVKSQLKRREGAEKELKAAHEAKSQALVSAQQAKALASAQQAELQRWRQLAEERAALVVQAENAAIEMRQACDQQVRSSGNVDASPTCASPGSCSSLPEACMAMAFSSVFPTG